MKRVVTVATVLGLAAIAASAMFALAGEKSSSNPKGSGSCDPAACESGTKATAAQSAGKVLGNFDQTTGSCRFSCAIQSKYDAKSVMAQPGAKDGKLTQCPVSGVVFSVDPKRPRVRIGSDDYVTCCESCAAKLRKNPRRFVRV